MTPPNAIGLRSGFQIPYVGRGGLMSGRRANLVIAVCNALLNSTMVKGSNTGIYIADKKLLFSIASSLSTGSPTQWVSDYDTTRITPYFEGDICRVRPGNLLVTDGYTEPGFITFSFARNARPGIYICLVQHIPNVIGAGTAKAWPQYPEKTIGTNYWQLVGGLEHWRGDYDTDPNTHEVGADYVIGDIVQVLPTSAYAGLATIAGTYICVKDVPNSSAFPVHPLVPPGPDAGYPGLDYWRLLSTYPESLQVCDSDGDPTEHYVDGQSAE